jgi:hypothetical protein
VRETIFREFNSLSVLYNKPSASFIAADHLIAAQPVVEPPPSGSAGGQDDDRLIGDEGEEYGLAGGGGGGAAGAAVGGGARAAAAAAPAPTHTQEIDLLGDDLLGLGLGSSSAPAPAPVAAYLLPTVALEASAFQGKWQALSVAATLPLRARRLPNSTGEVEALCRQQNIFTIASGDTGSSLKWFLYAQLSTHQFVLMEALLDKSNGNFAVTVKCDAGGAHAVVAAALKQALVDILLQ